MSVPRTVAEMLAEHGTLELEGMDRLYLNVYVPQLPCDGGVVPCFRGHRGQPIASSALMAPISRAFLAAIERFVAEPGIPLITRAAGGPSSRRGSASTSTWGARTRSSSSSPAE